MQLTDRQCWDVIRTLVKEKNEEYRKFLNIVFGDKEQVRKLLGFTRDSFLSKMGFYNVEQFNEYIKKQGNEPKKNSWLDNLSGEDLLIFLDFRCRTLQQMYDYRLRYKTLNRNNVRDFIESASISKLIGFNGGKLSCAGKPKRMGEPNVFELNVPVSEINEQALAQLMASLASKYSIVEKVSIDTAIQMTKNLVTSNFDLKDYETGYTYKGKVSIKSQLPEEFDFTNEDSIITRGKFVGVDIQGSPIFEKYGRYYDAVGIALSDDVEIFQLNGDDIFGL